jgi:hypothetical protein
MALQTQRYDTNVPVTPALVFTEEKLASDVVGPASDLINEESHKQIKEIFSWYLWND